MCGFAAAGQYFCWKERNEVVWDEVRSEGEKKWARECTDTFAMVKTICKAHQPPQQTPLKQVKGLDFETVFKP